MSQSKIKLAICDFFGYDLEMSEIYRLIAAAGFDCVMLSWCDFPNNPEYLKRVNAKLARSRGLYVGNIHAPFTGCNALWLEGGKGDDYLHALMSSVTDCAALDIPAVVAHLSSGDNPPQISNIGIERLKILVDYAEKSGVTLAFENVRRIEALRRVFAEFDSERVKFCFDSGHHNWRTSGIDILGEFGGRLCELHLHDNDGSDDQHLLPFDGGICWDDCVKKIAETGYDGAVTLEVGNGGYENLSAEEFLAEAFKRGEKIKRIMADAKSQNIAPIL